jgi:hypothetical protein
MRQEATANGGSRPAGATESATTALPADRDLAVVVAGWPVLPESVRADIVAAVRSARQ